MCVRDRKGSSEGVNKPGKWDKHRAPEYVHSINHDFVAQVIENADFKSVSDLDGDLRKVLIEL